MENICVTSLNNSTDSYFVFDIETKLNNTYIFFIDAELTRGYDTTIYCEDFTRSQIIKSINIGFDRYIKKTLIIEGTGRLIHFGIKFNKPTMIDMYINNIVVSCNNKILNSLSVLKSVNLKFSSVSSKNIITASPKISVILPSLNRGHKCCRVIKDIVNQIHNNFEVLVIDDGSIKTEYDIKKNFIENLNDIRFIFINNEVNLGISKTLNKGIELSTGEYVTWISDDNFYFSNFLSELVSLKTDFAHSAFEYKNDIGEIITIINNYNDFDALVCNFAGLGSFMWKKSIMLNIGQYNTKLSCLIEDYDYLLRTYLKTNNIGFTEKILMSHYTGSETLSFQRNGLMLEYFALLKKFYSIIRDVLKFNYFKILVRNIVQNNPNVMYIYLVNDNIVTLDANKLLLSDKLHESIISIIDKKKFI